MAEKPESKVPPYVGFGTFMNFIKGLKETGVPGRVDNSIMRTMSGGAQSSLLNGLRYFNFIAEDGTPQPKLAQLVMAADDERPAILRDALESSYPFLASKGLLLATATPQQLNDALRECGAGGGTLEKARAFLLSAAKDAAMTVSAHIAKPRNGNGSPPRRARTPATPKSAPRRERRDRTGDDPPPPPPPAPPSVDPMLMQLMAKFPDFDPGWPPELQAQWMAGFDKLMARVAPDRK